MFRLGFIGLGGMGRYQVKSFLKAEGCRIAGGCDPSAAAREEFARICPDAAVFSDHREVLNQRGIDAIIVAVPTGFHSQIVIDALGAGKHVLVEKPMARTVEECRRMLDAAQRARKVLMVAHCRRFDEDWGAFARTYRAGDLGEAVLWRNVRGGQALGPWFMDDKMGGGPLFDGAIHNLDFANLLFGPVQWAMGNSIKFDPQCSAVDTGNLIIQYQNGCQMLLSWSWAVHGAWLHDVLGPKSTFVFGPNGLEVPAGRGGHCIIDRKGEKKLVTFEMKDMYVTQARHFIDCLNGAACQSPGNEAIKAVAVGEAVLKACREQRIVEVPI
jgi:UDP-N-acetylglucosamine 3-dehydrogenase